MGKLSFTILICLLLLATQNVIARQDISLKKIAKLNLSIVDGGLSYKSNIKKYVIVNEKGIWKSYQLKDSLTSVFVKDVAQKQLADLFKIINSKDTSIKSEQFNIRHQEMAVAFDSLIKTDFLNHDSITPQQKETFITALGDKKRIDLMLRKLLIPERMDDKTEYKISITMKSGKTKTISALSFAQIYNLPWNVDGKRLYNPNISRIFALLTGDKGFDKKYKGYMYYRLMLHIYGDEFRTPFVWANLKENFPEAVNRLGSTLLVARCLKTEYNWNARFSSSLLPNYVLIGGAFSKPDTFLPEIKYLENRLIKLKEQNHYLFKYLQHTPDLRAEAIVNEKYLTNNDPIVLVKLKAKYKKLIPLAFEQVTFIDVYKTIGVPRGTWVDKCILLPDGTLIVIQCRRPEGILQSTALVYDVNGDLLETLTDLDLSL